MAQSQQVCHRKLSLLSSLPVLVFHQRAIDCLEFDLVPGLLAAEELVAHRIMIQELWAWCLNLQKAIHLEQQRHHLQRGSLLAWLVPQACFKALNQTGQSQLLCLQIDFHPMLVLLLSHRILKLL